MPRPEKQIAEEGIAAGFAAELRKLRAAAGGPTYRVMAKLANYSPTTLSEAASGKKLPSWEATAAYVRVCGGDVHKWRRKWEQAAGILPEISVVRSSGTTQRNEISPATRRIATASGRTFREWSTDSFAIWTGNDNGKVSVTTPAPEPARWTAAEPGWPAPWPDPKEAVTLDDFGPLLNQLRERAELSYRELESRARAQAHVAGDRQIGVARSTLSDILSGNRRPSLKQIRLIVRVCREGAPEELERWERAWTRIAEFEARAEAALKLLRTPVTLEEEGLSELAREGEQLGLGGGSPMPMMISVKRYKLMFTVSSTLMAITTLILILMAKS